MANYITLPDGSRCYSGANCLRHGKRSLPANFTSKPFNEQLADLEKLNNPLASQEPKQIDDKIADLYEAYYEEQFAAATIKNSIEYLKKPYYRSRPDTTDRLKKLEQKLTEQETKMKAVLDEIVPYETEYSRRPWTRGFLVNNTNGHVHKNTRCSTCTPTTRYMWLTEYSGKTETELVNDAGSRACTVCYPSAPVDVLNREATLNHPVLRASREEKEQKRLEKERKLAEQQTKAIFKPDGKPLKDDFGSVIKTIMTAENRASELYAEKQAVENGIMNFPNQVYFQQRQDSYKEIMEAIAYKKGVTVEEAEKELQPKFTRKYKNDWEKRR